MTARTTGGARRILPGTRGFTVLLSVAMGMTALAIDSLLPAFDEIRAEFGLEPGATDVAALVTAFIVGMGLGQVPAGLLADRYGRRPVLWGGVALYIVGAIGALLAPSLGLMIASRFVWGLGAAGPRVAVMAMVRDAYQGARMAREMSTIMAVFLLVPMFAPAIGAGLVAVGPWQLTIWLCIVVATLLFAASTRLPSTAPPNDRPPLSVGELGRSWKVVLTTPGTVGYLVATTAMMAAFMSYIASSENIIDEVFGLKNWFAVVFGLMGAGLAVANLANGRIVEAVGLERLLTGVPPVQLGVALALMVVAVVTDGRPPFALYAGLLLALLMAQQVTMVNINSAAMQPLGHIAGTGAAVIGMVPTVVGSLLGSLVDRQFDGTITPLTLAFLIAAVVALVSTRRSLRQTAPAIS